MKKFIRLPWRGSTESASESEPTADVAAEPAGDETRSELDVWDDNVTMRFESRVQAKRRAKLYIDDAALSRRLAAKVRRRRAAGIPDANLGPAENTTPGWARTAVKNGEKGPLASIVGVVIMVVVAAVASAPWANVLLAVFVALVVGNAIQWTVGTVWSQTSSLNLAPSDRSAIEKATARRALPGREEHIVAVAEEVTALVRSSPAWHSDALTDHRVRLDLDEEMRQIRAAATRLRVARAVLDVRPTIDGSEHAVAAQQAWNERADLVDTAERALLRRIALLYGYQESLRSLESVLANLEVVRRMAAADHNIDALHADIAHHELRSQNTRDLTLTLTEIEAGLQAQIDHLRTGVFYTPRCQPRSPSRRRGSGVGTGPGIGDISTPSAPPCDHKSLVRPGSAEEMIRETDRRIRLPHSRVQISTRRHCRRPDTPYGEEPP